MVTSKLISYISLIFSSSFKSKAKYVEVSLIQLHGRVHSSRGAQPQVYYALAHSVSQHNPCNCIGQTCTIIIFLLFSYGIRKYKRPSGEMLKDVSSVIESSVPNSNKIKIEAADVSIYECTFWKTRRPEQWWRCTECYFL